MAFRNSEGRRSGRISSAAEANLRGCGFGSDSIGDKYYYPEHQSHVQPHVQLPPEIHPRIQEDFGGDLISDKLDLFTHLITRLLMQHGIIRQSESGKLRRNLTWNGFDFKW